VDFLFGARIRKEIQFLFALTAFQSHAERTLYIALVEAIQAHGTLPWVSVPLPWNSISTGQPGQQSVEVGMGVHFADLSSRHGLPPEPAGFSLQSVETPRVQKVQYSTAT